MNAKTTKSLRRSALQPKPDADNATKGESAKPAFTDKASTASADSSASPSPRPKSKIALITGLLTRSGGASLDELVVATSWQPHTTRAALTGLRNKGHTLTKDKVDGVTRYTIAAAA